MQVDVNRLKGYIVASGKTQEQIAKEIGVDNSTFIRKMKNKGVSFSVGQMHQLVEILKMPIPVASEIFLFTNSQ